LASVSLPSFCVGAGVVVGAEAGSFSADPAWDGGGVGCFWSGAGADAGVVVVVVIVVVGGIEGDCVVADGVEAFVASFLGDSGWACCC